MYGAHMDSHAAHKHWHLDIGNEARCLGSIVLFCRHDQMVAAVDQLARALPRERVTAYAWDYESQAPARDWTYRVDGAAVDLDLDALLELGTEVMS